MFLVRIGMQLQVRALRETWRRRSGMMLLQAKYDLLSKSILRFLAFSSDISNQSIMKPFKTQGWQYYDRCKVIMYTSKARGGRAFFAGLGSAVTPAPSSSSNIVMAPVESESTISIDHGIPTASNPTFINYFGEIHNKTNSVASLYAAQNEVKPAFLHFGHSGVMGEDGEHISISSSNYGIKRSHDSMTTSTPPSVQSFSSQPPPSTQPTGPSSDHLISSIPLPSASPPKKRSRGSKTSDVIAPPSRAQKEKLTTAVAVNGMQGTINRMTDMLANVLDPNALATAFVTASASAAAPAPVSMSSSSNTSTGPAHPPAASGSSTSSSDKRVVLQHLKNDGGLTRDEKARLLYIFTKNRDAVETYLEVLDDDELHLGYARELLKDI